MHKIGLISSLSCSGDTPGVGLLVLVVQGLDPLRLLELGQLGRVREPKQNYRGIYFAKCFSPGGGG